MKTVELVENSMPSLLYDLYYRNEHITINGPYSYSEALEIAYKLGFTHYRFNGVEKHHGRRLIKNAYKNHPFPYKGVIL